MYVYIIRREVSVVVELDARFEKQFDRISTCESSDEIGPVLTRKNSA